MEDSVKGPLKGTPQLAVQRGGQVQLAGEQGVWKEASSTRTL
jgi:hypothetical protein